MSGEAVLNTRRVAGSSLAGQTQSRERHHADVRLELFSTSQSHCIKRSFCFERRGRQSASAGDVGRIEEVLYSSGSVVNCSG